MTKQRDGGLRQIVQTWLPDVQWQAIETWSTGQGVPDLHYIIKGGYAGWIECKQTVAWSVGVKPEQVGWAERYARYGGRSFFFVRQFCKAGPRVEARDVLWVIGSGGGRALADRGLRAFDESLVDGDGTHLLLCCQGGPAEWRWDLIRKIMTIAAS